MTAHSLSQAHLKELLHYDPDAGVFTRRVTRSVAKAGSVAGKIKDGYVEIHVSNKNYLAHRLAFLYMEGAWPPHEVDHENHICNDNRWCNIHHATRTENTRNASLSKSNTSGTCGVYWNKQKQKWYVRIGTDHGRMHGGYFKTKQEAITRRRQLEREHQYHANHGT